MKINRDMATRAALTLLNQIGLEQLTLRRLAAELAIQPATLYWHFKDKQELLDEMATTVLTEGAPSLLPRKPSADWPIYAATYANGLRHTLMAYRDGARMISGTRLTSTEPLKPTETIAARLVAAGFTLRAAVVLLTTLYNYTLSFAMEEQAVFPTPDGLPPYSLADRTARLDPALFPLHRQATPILFDRYDRRFKEGLDLILRGAQAQQAPEKSPA